MTPLKIYEMDHIVLNVSDIERSLKFYTEILGLAGERVEEFRSGKVGFPSVRINADTIIDLSPKKTSAPARKDAEVNLNHFCLVAEAADLAQVAEHLKSRGVEILTGPVSRWGARGRATSIYILDPDGNEIEIRCY
ncbi:MAG TPA: VOC family protein [Candidatus Acidoferrales bacterium]|nr:VOC family protein [Candidatus Acidoferrales bacterium]